MLSRIVLQVESTLLVSREYFLSNMVETSIFQLGLNQE